MKLLIRNLARSTTETELRTLFQTHGTVQSCKLVMDSDTGKSKGFGFVEMPKKGEAKAAMKLLNGKDIAGNRIRVKKAESKPVSDKGPASGSND
ncbi:MAG: RNA-binding protein [Gammaproteobacteria bacterium]|nr:RNA-binding protein [Gammaproteobacteria bacterium]MDH5778138.1 RNA-binding protein [Gammaproteobacteria bacterium]